MTTLIFDTETTGLVKNWQDAGDPKNPHMVQLGMCLCEDNRIVRTCSALVRPDGWTIPDEAIAVHGITNEMANKHGLSIENILGQYVEFAYKADIVVAHNYKFDCLVIDKAFTGKSIPKPIKPSFCTMLESTQICCIPKANGGFKWPKLQEVYKFLFKQEFVGAHDALSDVLACKRVYFALRAIEVTDECCVGTN